MDNKVDQNTMRQVSARISTYTADVSGVCSALFELGGMTVIHDPSGCNSTYNTHDEPRWYNQDSLVFISGLTQMDAILGNDEKFIRDIIRAAEDLKPSFIALVRTPVPLLNGTDFEGIAREIEERTGIPVMHFPTTGMETYMRGAGMALEAVADRIPGPALYGSGGRKENESSRGDEKQTLEAGPWVNILGATPLDFSIGPTLDSLRQWLEARGYQVRSCFAMGSGPDEIRSAAAADLNLVISGLGLPAARVLKRRFGIPYIMGFPVDDYGPVLDGVMKGLCGIKSGMNAGIAGRQWRMDRKEKECILDAGSCVIIGEPVTSVSLACAMYMRKGSCPDVISPLETDPEIVTWGQEALSLQEPGASGIRCRPVRGEAAIEETIRSYRRIIADPLYKPVCPEKAEFISLPHEAFSGRIYRKQIPDLLHALEELGLE